MNEIQFILYQLPEEENGCFQNGNNLSKIQLRGFSRQQTNK